MFQSEVLQYKQRCHDLESHLEEGYHIPESPARTVTAVPGSPLDAAQQHLREMREERIHDLETALHRLDEERRRYVHRYINI